MPVGCEGTRTREEAESGDRRMEASLVYAGDVQRSRRAAAERRRHDEDHVTVGRFAHGPRVTQRQPV